MPQLLLPFFLPVLPSTVLLAFSVISSAAVVPLPQSMPGATNSCKPRPRAALRIATQCEEVAICHQQRVDQVTYLALGGEVVHGVEGDAVNVISGEVELGAQIPQHGRDYLSFNMNAKTL